MPPRKLFSMLRAVDLRSASHHLGRRRSLLWLGTLTAIAAFSFWTHTNTATTNSGLVIPKDRLSLGEMWESSAFSLNLPITNTSSTPVTVSGIMATCSCTVIEPTRLKLAPGQVENVRVALDLTSAFNRKTSTKHADFSVGLIPVIEGASPWQQRGWTITGSVRRVLDVSPSSIYYDEGIVYGQGVPPQRINLTAFLSLDDLKVTCLPADFGKVAINQTSERSYQVQLTPTQSIAPGPFRFHLRVAATPKGQSGQANFMIPVSGLMIDRVQVVPRHICFGARSVGTIAEESVVLLAPANERVQLVLPDDETADFFFSGGRAQEPGQNCKVVVRQRISAVGYQEFTRRLSCRHNGAVINVPITISYHGLSGTANE